VADIYIKNVNDFGGDCTLSYLRLYEGYVGELAFNSYLSFILAAKVSAAQVRLTYQNTSRCNVTAITLQ